MRVADIAPAAVILAAGEGRRLGGRNKAALEVAGEQFLAMIVRKLRALACKEISVVVAAPYAEVNRKSADALGIDCIENMQPELGMASSVSLGFEWAQQHYESDWLLLWPVDTPAVKEETLQALAKLSLSTERRGGAQACILQPRFADRGGHPICVHRDLWREFAKSRDFADGARAVVRAHRDKILRYSVEDSFVVKDVDRVGDLLAMSPELGQGN